MNREQLIHEAESVIYAIHELITDGQESASLRNHTKIVKLWYRLRIIFNDLCGTINECLELLTTKAYKSYKIIEAYIGK